MKKVNLKELAGQLDCILDECHYISINSAVRSSPSMGNTLDTPKN